MGSGKKNKRGGAPKAKGRLAAALSTAQQAAALKARQAQAEANKEELLNNKKNKEANKQAKKKRRVERLLNEVAEEKRKGKERATELQQLLDEEEMSSDEEGSKAEGTKEIVVKTVAPPRKRRGTVPYKLGERILLVGEGNFSFAHALLLAQPPIVTPQLLYATAYDSQQTAQEKYPDLMEHVNAIRKAGATVLFGVDATKLQACKELKEHKGAWDRVVFNFPHVGQGITDQDRNVRANQTLVLGFFRSVAPLLRVGTSSIAAAGAKKAQTNKKGKRTRRDDSEDEAPPIGHGDDDFDSDMEVDSAQLADPALRPLPPPPTTSGTVLVTLRTVSPYSLWSVQHLGTRGSLLAPSILPKPLPKTPQPDYLLVRSFEFDPNDWQGYEHRRTVGFKEGVSSEKNDDLQLTARERGEKRRWEKEQQERREKEERDANAEIRKGGKALMRTWEFELKDVDGLYD
ncbi:BZ3500_MvSof-1268-A1-R1_Chr9g10590 [Microbotryum saponariae]|uniref:BZ3500_MvSof-1268-A1-R1_Chr9g10590 protein n=1 Tax=Microbotryum saponariae TaxID=289078 RepID=A0A2X0L751_9BASI|nr:BZ3501_MvSof-1269-A2-R1_Chr9g10338 [Microbotryum saponariae]SDA00348.1 BZ3500_MvSof-1268-A1-R1_Chr9g10590 [Microbotryum saponariae]